MITNQLLSTDELIAKWIKRIFRAHFREQKKINTDKIFIKISGFTESQVKAILGELKRSTSQLEESYSPTIRTITPIEGYVEFGYREHETSTWLRNNTRFGEALILIINELTPEAQSLENLYSIDENYLISDSGLDTLYSMLAENYQLVAEEIEDIDTFIKMYKRVNEPQLLDLANFLVNIVDDNKFPSIIQRIQNSLPELNLFKDSKLIISKSSFSRIKDNFFLANLQTSTSTLDTEKLADKVYSFIEAEDSQTDYLENINKTQFQEDAINFLNHKNKNLFEYDYELIDYVFKYKEKQKTLVTKVKEVFELEELTEEEKKTYEDGIEALENKDDPELIQEFVDEFSGVLDKAPGLIKSINRVIDKLRHPAEYDDLSKALLYESFNLIDGSTDDINSTDVSFELKFIGKKMNSRTKRLIELYLLGINSVLPNFTFLKTSLPDECDEASKETETTFELSILHNGEQLNQNKFKLLNLQENNLYQLIQLVEEGKVPYIKNHLENEVAILDSMNFLEQNVDLYVAANNEEMKKSLVDLKEFNDYYLNLLKDVSRNGILSVQIKELEKRVEDFSSQIYQSVNVSKEIYKSLNIMGAIDTINSKIDEAGYAQERIITLINPIRLLSYLHRFGKMNDQIQNWITKAANSNLEIEKLNEYLEYVSEQTMYLAPRYFTSDGDEAFLIEVSEKMGEGFFTLNTAPIKNQDHLAKEFSEELLKVTKNYLEVYPYAKDGLDILFLYCQSSEVISKSIEVLYKGLKGISKLKIAVHSTQAAILHQKLNKWISQREEFTKPINNGKFPLVELKIISGDKISDISNHVKHHMIDADLVVLTDYFGHSNQIKYDFEKINSDLDSDWFIKPYKEPLLNKEAIKRIPYVSEHLPQTLQNFYQLQYIIQSSSMPEKDEVYVLKNKIALNNFSDNTLIEFMHDNFNWIMIMDRFLDKSLLKKASSKAQIIQYKSKAGANKNYKLILSSSQYLRKVSSQVKDYAYYDRLTRKLKEILKNEQINNDNVKKAVDLVKDISGALVLKVIGPGKYAHEMMATYLSINSYNKDKEGLAIWSICDELPWFASNKRRPDLVLTQINKNSSGSIDITFELKELKFINHRIFDREKADSLKQIQAGRSLYENIFDFPKDNTDSAYWKDELLHYFIEKDSYTTEEADVLTMLQYQKPKDINVNFKSSVDLYCYTSNLSEYHYEKIEDGVFIETDEDHTTNIFNRYYILKELGAFEENLPLYEELDENITLEEQLKNNEIILPGFDSTTGIEDQVTTDPIDENEGGDPGNNGFNIDPKPEPKPIVDPISDLNPDPFPDPDGQYPEVIALSNLNIAKENIENDHSELKKQYQNLLIRNFNKNGISIKVNNIIVGSSVIRLVIGIPSDISARKITSRGNDIQLWLGLNNEPHIFINSQGINIDIVREDPETIYFEDFMALTRKQIQDEIKVTNLIAPLGLDPLNNVIYIDLSDSTTPHLLTGGTTGSGKSVTLNSVILGIMCLYKPDNVKFIFIDPKKVEFAIYENKQHTESVITEINEAVTILERLINAMEDRYSKFAKVGATNLEEYYEITETTLPRLVVVFDEFADFMSQEKEIAKTVENAILRLGQKARAAGIHLIICTQNPKADIINTNIRNNLGARLALRAADANASQVILDSDGAERLAGKGDFLAKVSFGKVERGKSPFLTPKVKAALIRFFEK
ncbi:FtsK/SpoIIIE domain-containing protein [Fictibacillus sp. B-59209]|uniref:FtsK/SpoIIIE domain-containing protein n=1 Tax=Fictibacillus sp. B-59209 TaxID=3024873 RepID=UPI002E1C8AED|nr:FtsK/SpoIIIE domain-containing protein [Fictibacillus sp. B-59209]